MTKTSNQKLKVFLCHASEDKPVVRGMFQLLSSEDWIQPWLDDEVLFPGQDWNMEIEKAVERADVVLVFLSTNSVSKEGYIQKELRFVLDIALQKPDGTIFVVPIRLEDCPVPRRLRIWHFVDYFPESDRKRAFNKLTGSLSKKYVSLKDKKSLEENNLKEHAKIKEQIEENVVVKKNSSEKITLESFVLGMHEFSILSLIVAIIWPTFFLLTLVDGILGFMIFVFIGMFLFSKDGEIVTQKERIPNIIVLVITEIVIGVTFFIQNQFLP